MKGLIFMFSLVLGLNANDGFFGSDEPPKDFLSLKVTAISSSRQEVTFSIQEFV